MWVIPQTPLAGGNLTATPCVAWDFVRGAVKRKLSPLAQRVQE